MQISEAFEKYNFIFIQYYWSTYCKKISNYYYEIDEEYSFSGTLDDFNVFLVEYPIFDLETEINHVTGNLFCLISDSPESCYRSLCNDNDFDYHECLNIFRKK